MSDNQNQVHRLKSVAQRAVNLLNRNKDAGSLGADLQAAVRDNEAYVKQLENRIATLQRQLAASQQCNQR